MAANDLQLLAGTAAALPENAETPVYVSNFINRDLSLIEFTRRVLDEAKDKSQPLLERVKFISIVSSNTDEFFMIRVAGLKEKLGHEVGVPLDGISTFDLLAEIKRLSTAMTEEQMACLRDEILPELERQGVAIKSFASLTEKDRRALSTHFDENIYPLLTPQAVDPTHPFPYISGGSLNLGMYVKPKLTKRVAKKLENTGDEFFVRVKIPASMPRLIEIDGSPDTFVLIEDLIISHIKNLVPEAEPESCQVFRITRDADIDLREDETEDLLGTMEENLDLRRFGNVVRLEVSRTMSDAMIEHLIEALEITTDDIYTIDGPLNLASLMQLYSVNRPDLKDAPLRVTTPSVIESAESKFDLIREKDILLHHPYMPYTIVTDLIKEAANDPDVLAIKMCLYRIGAESPIAPLLIEASKRGKQVTVVIEIKARFDEENNIEWAKRFEEAGIHVVYGLLGLKTHCKTTLIVRREEQKLVRYVHLATGNYNPETSAFYTDLGILTADAEIGADATELFNYLTGYSQRGEFKQLLVAPIYLREKMLGLIRRETQNANNGRSARIIAKMNRLADVEIVNALYEASQAGVEIDLIVRGICTLRPGVALLSENIRVRTIVGRLLEHSRLYYFENAGDPEIFTGSADWMPRNLDRRVEVLTPVFDKDIRMYFSEQFLAFYLQDNVKARVLREDGSYERVQQAPGEAAFDSQMSFQAGAEVIYFDSGGK